MTPYDKTNWQDRVVERPRTYTETTNPDGSITLTPAPGTIVQEGTPVNAGAMNHLEAGVWDAYWQSESTPLADDVETVMVRESGQLAQVDERVAGVLRRRTQLTRSGGKLASVTTTVYAANGTTVIKQWTDTLVRSGDGLVNVDREVIV